MKPVVERLMGKTIISVQAYEDTPLYGPQNMRIMAQSVLMGGAEGLRACWPQDIRAIRAITSKPIVGIYKDLPEGQDPLDAIYITPTLERAKEVIDAGADVLGLDCTLRPQRGLEALKALLGEVHRLWPHIARYGRFIHPGRRRGRGRNGPCRHHLYHPQRLHAQQSGQKGRKAGCAADTRVEKGHTASGKRRGPYLGIGRP